jgi:hypothetical protein
MWIEDYGNITRKSREEHTPPAHVYPKVVYGKGTATLQDSLRGMRLYNLNGGGNNLHENRVRWSLHLNDV